jgi:hypothetical protein
MGSCFRRDDDESSACSPSRALRIFPIQNFQTTKMQTVLTRHCFAPLAVTSKHTSAFPRLAAPELCENLPPMRAWGMPGAQRTRSLACKMEINTRVSHHRFAEITRHSRTRVVLTVSFVLSPVTGLVATVLRGKPPRTRHQRRGVGTTRLRRPHQRRSSKALPASTASRRLRP